MHEPSTRSKWPSTCAGPNIAFPANQQAKLAKLLLNINIMRLAGGLTITDASVPATLDSQALPPSWSLSWSPFPTHAACMLSRPEKTNLVVVLLCWRCYTSLWLECLVQSLGCSAVLGNSSRLL